MHEAFKLAVGLQQADAFYDVAFATFRISPAAPTCSPSITDCPSWWELRLGVLKHWVDHGVVILVSIDG